MSSTFKKRKHLKRRYDEMGDAPYVDPSETAKRPRPSYESSRKTVEQRQKMRRTDSGAHWLYESALTPGIWHKLDNKKREEVPRAAAKRHKKSIRRKPALDHIVQFAAVKQVYHTQTEIERSKKPPLQRRSSFDLHEAFHAATKDASNLRLLSHGEHKSAGGSKRANQFSATELGAARQLYEKHYPTIPSTPSQNQGFSANRPRSAVPAPMSTNTTTQPRRSPRLAKTKS